MEPGNLVRFEDYTGDVYIGYVICLDTDYDNEVYCRIRWHDGSITDEYEDSNASGTIEVIQ
jgi:hypothetical protein